MVVMENKNNTGARGAMRGNASVEQIILFSILLIVLIASVAVFNSIDHLYTLTRDNVDAELALVQLSTLMQKMNGLTEGSRIATYLSGNRNWMNISVVNDTVVVYAGDQTYFRYLGFNATPVNLTLNSYVNITKNRTVTVRNA